MGRTPDSREVCGTSEAGRRLENLGWRSTSLELTSSVTGRHLLDSEQVGSRVKTLTLQFGDGTFLHTMAAPHAARRSWGPPFNFVTQPERGLGPPAHGPAIDAGVPNSHAAGRQSPSPLP